MTVLAGVCEHGRIDALSPVALAEVVCVLDEDPDLAADVAHECLSTVRAAARARCHRVEVGAWAADDEAAVPGSDGLGLLVLSGMCVRRVGHGDRHAGELLGGGDLLRPWEEPGMLDSMPFATAWRVIEPLRLAVLDDAFLQRVAPHRRVVAALMARALQRSRACVVNLAIANESTAEQRVWMQLWHLADRWGRMTPAGVALAAPITHALLSDLVAIRRPSVTAAIGELERRRMVSRPLGRFVLHGAPPAERARLLRAGASA